MMFYCPHCSAGISISVANLPDSDADFGCPRCGASFALGEQIAGARAHGLLAQAHTSESTNKEEPETIASFSSFAVADEVTSEEFAPAGFSESDRTTPELDAELAPKPAPRAPSLARGGLDRAIGLFERGQRSRLDDQVSAPVEPKATAWVERRRQAFEKLSETRERIGEIRERLSEFLDRVQPVLLGHHNWIGLAGKALLFLGVVALGVSLVLWLGTGDPQPSKTPDSRAGLNEPAPEVAIEADALENGESAKPAVDKAVLAHALPLDDESETDSAEEQEPTEASPSEILPSTALPKEQGAAYFPATVSGSGVRLRSSPGNRAAIVARLGHGQRVRVYDQFEGWALVVVESGTAAGFVSQSLLSKTTK
jgi:hypothetical protein